MCRIILGGTGGQGIVTLGKLLAIAGMDEGKEVSCYPIYGAEIRGGYAFATIIISESPIPSPIVSRADVGIFLEPFAYDYLNSLVVKNGLLVVNADLVKPKTEKKREIFMLPADSLAQKLGDKRCANMVVAGFLAKKAGENYKILNPFPALNSLKEALPAVFTGKPGAVSLNEKALLAGYRS
ncbi:MAG: 2-oxoacid:acceptor oxidoreductase family protein [Candidatus Omnitrophota bacterium]